MRLKGIGEAGLSKVRSALDKANLGLEVVRPLAGRAVDRAHRQYEVVKPHLPTVNDIEKWARENAAKYGWGEKPASASLEHLEQVLTQTVAAIQQTSDRRTRIIVNAVIGKLGGAATVGGIAGFVSSFGVASTGTAIASLSGAAATTAQLYWLGSLIGLGTAAGGLMLAAGGLGAGVAAGFWGRRKLFGKPRTEDDLQEHEKAILVACITLINAVKQQNESGESVSPVEIRLVAEQALIPLANQINQHWDETALKENGKSECRPFTRTLASLQRRKLNQCRTELGRIAISAMAATTEH